ncbi:MAG: hypothetical protein IJ829_08305, partial [Kiritimatiellae bacterium]|nr:hypothetical protein [Kiritimatiellia bacterium]
VGGDAANLRAGTLATSGVDNTGAGGGGGSMVKDDATETAYWRGGDGGDGVVLIAYEVHGRDPISEEPRISMTKLDYTDERGYADISYRAYWAGIQADTSDIYVLYSTDGEEAVAEGRGEMVKVATGQIGIGGVTFTPPEKGHTYWVRLVARKDANSFMYSDEILSFEAPAVRINGVTWTAATKKVDGVTVPDPDKDYAYVLYNVYDNDPDALLYCYWSEARADLEGDAEPSGDGVRSFLVTTDIADNFADPNNKSVVGATRFKVEAATHGLERNKVYYFRLALGDEDGTKFFLSPRIMTLETVETPYVVFPEATWDTHVVTADLMLSTANLEPSSVELLALYGTLDDITNKNPITLAGVSAVNLGTCDLYPRAVQTKAQFPLCSPVATNYFLRLALKSTVGAVTSYYYSARNQEITLTALPTNTILVCAQANPKVGCYGDEPPAFDYEVTYSGYTNTVAWAHKPGVEGAVACEATAASPSGLYAITQGTLAPSSTAPYVHEEEVAGEEGTTTEPVTYSFLFAYAKANYTITNAVFSASVADVRKTYTGETLDLSEIVPEVSGLRGGQTARYSFRPVGSSDWSSAFAASYTDVGTHTVEFKASADSHDDVFGLFTVVVEPAPLTATIEDVNLTYTGGALAFEPVTNVTGLVKGEVNKLTLSFRDAAGEWGAEPPTFVNPGTYTVEFRAEAPNHVTSVASCTVTVGGWDFKVNMDGASGYETPLRVTDPGWFLTYSGKTGVELADAATRHAALDAVCPNGLKLWQNYLIGRTAFGEKLVASILQAGSLVQPDSFVVRFADVEVLRNTGLAVKYRLDRRRPGEADFTLGELSDKYEMNVPLAPGDPSGLYRFNIVLAPTNALYSGESVLASVTTVGVLRVSSALTNTVVAVPWGGLTIATEENLPVAVKDVVNPNGLASGDLIVAYDSEEGKFCGWSHGEGVAWDALRTVTKKGGVTLEPSDTTGFAQGGAFWLARSAPTGCFYLLGRYTGDEYEVRLAPGSDGSPGHTLVANPTFEAVALDDLDFRDGGGAKATPHKDDRIVFQSAAGVEVTYIRNAANTAWGRNVAVRQGRRVSQEWQTGGSVPAGTGFWYVRSADANGALVIKFGGAE